MENRLVQLQVFFEISMSIGTSLNLKKMLQKSLVVYLRKLNCASGLILQKNESTKRFSQVFSIPRIVDRNPAIRAALKLIDRQLDGVEFDQFVQLLPLCGTSKNDQTYYIMVLPGFGLLILSKGGVAFDQAILKSLKQVNLKLAGSCLACLQNEKIENINTQLSDEIIIRKTTEKQLKQLTNELEQRVGARTRQLDSANKELIVKIKEIEKKEQSLRESEERYRTVMEANPDPIVVYDAQMNVVFLNPAFTRVFGWTFEDVAGKRLDFVPPENKTDIDHVLEEVSLNGYCFGFESKRQTKDQTIIDVSISAAAYKNQKGDALGIIVNLRDITQLRQAQNMMIQNEKMVSVGGLAAGMAHEINNPLAGILQTMQVVGNRLFGDLPANETCAKECGISLKDLKAYLTKRDVFKLIQNIMTSGKKAAKIVEDMLSFSHKESSKFTQVGVHTLIDDALFLAHHDYFLKKECPFGQIEIRKDYNLTLPVLKCVPGQIRQVVFNIIKNAAQAMGTLEKKQIQPAIDIRTKLEDQSVIIEIQDTGPGMEKDVLDRIFEPFYTTKKVWGGTGLGLSVSYFIVKDHHQGDIVVTSTPGKGACFRVKLPYTEPT